LYVFPAIVHARHISVLARTQALLVEINAAKMEWAIDNHKTNGAIVTESDIKLCMWTDANGHIPKCPDGGTYIIGRVGEPVRSSMGLSTQPDAASMTNGFSATRGEDLVANLKEAYGPLFGWREQKP
jgi:hypothetical protein